MSFFVADRKENIDQGLLAKEDGHLMSVQVPLSEQQRHQLKQMGKVAKLKVLLRLLVDFLRKNNIKHEIIESIECKRDDVRDYQVPIKPFIAFLKQIADQFNQYREQQKLQKQMFELIDLKEQYLGQINQIELLLSKIGSNTAALRSQSQKLRDVEMKKISIYEVLLRNMELRMAALGRGNQHMRSHDGDLSDRLEEAEDKLKLMRSIVKNGGWGLIQQIKERVNAMKE